MNEPETTHDWILRRVSTRWIDRFPGRNAMPPEELPPHANDPSPCFLVALRRDEWSAEDVGADFIRRMHTDARYSLMQVPGHVVWLAVDGEGTRYAIVYWSNWNEQTGRLLQEYVAQTGRSCGALQADGLNSSP